MAQAVRGASPVLRWARWPVPVAAPAGSWAHRVPSAPTAYDAETEW